MKNHNHNHQKQHPNQNNTQHNHNHNNHSTNSFKSNHIPTERISLFNNTNDFYLFDKKFYNTLNIDIFPTKTLVYDTSNNSLGEFNPDIMTLSLNTPNEIITDLNLNCSLEKDFLSNSMNVLYEKTYENEVDEGKLFLISLII